MFYVFVEFQRGQKIHFFGYNPLNHLFLSPSARRQPSIPMYAAPNSSIKYGEILQ